MALVRNIIAQSTVDGVGNRTAIFLQGCNIRCAYCHNPETQALRDSEAKEMTVAEVSAAVMRNLPFIRGITASGGECMLQAAFLTELFTHLKTAIGASFSCLIDSNGTVPFARYPDLMRVTDGVMLDVKAWDKTIYQRLTGATDNQVVKDNLLYLLQQRKLTEVRVVCLPQDVAVTTDVENILQHLAAVEGFVEQQIPVRLLRFRPHGVIGELSTAPMPTDDQMLPYQNLAQTLHLPVTVK